MFLFIISWKLKRRFRNCQYTGQTSLNLSIKAKRKLTTKFLQSLNFSLTEMKIRVLVKYNLSANNPQTLDIFIEFHNDLLYINKCFWHDNVIWIYFISITVVVDFYIIVMFSYKSSFANFEFFICFLRIPLVWNNVNNSFL